MKMRTFVGFFALAGLFLALPPAAAQDKAPQDKAPKAAAPEAAKEQLAMQRYAAYAAPGEAHNLLKKRVGNWSYKLKTWDAPGATPEESSGTSQLEMIMDGRYLIDRSEGTFTGKPFSGMGMYGFDNIRQKFIATWVDNMGTGIMLGEGTWDATTKTLNFKTFAPNPAAGTYMTIRSTLRMVDDNNWVFEMLDRDDETEFKVMEISYTRK